MNIVILHCHFERGGVTQVVENHVRCLRDCERVDRIILVSGDRASGLSPETLESVTRVTADDFDYDATSDLTESATRRAERMAQQLQQLLRGVGVTQDNGILHWHNHSLGKNTAGPGAIRQMAHSGWRFLLQIHDFAEDNRPENYERLIAASGAAKKSQIDQYLYPIASQIHYATLTQADQSVLTQLGIADAQTHCLPNSVLALPAQQCDKQAAILKVRRAMNLPDNASWCLYPVRGIRRKNVGEFVMLSRWLPEAQFAGLTLEPATPVERRSYERWKQLATEVAPRAVFDAAHHPSVSFAENVLASDFIVSTSVAEGFGMAYLEPWLSHRSVIARRLRTVTDDFEAFGVQLPTFYDSIPIPGDREWIRDCLTETVNAKTEAWSDLPEHFRPSLDLGIDSTPESIDFALLTPHRQTDVLRQLASDAGFESATQERSRGLIESLERQPDEQLLRHNAEVVNEQYSSQRTGERLLAIYEQLIGGGVDSEVVGPSHAGEGIDLINEARPFFPCRTEVFRD